MTDALLAEVVRRAGLDDLRAEIIGALGTLSDDTRKAVELRVIDELPYATVADRLGLTEVATRARVSRGLTAPGRILDPNILHQVTA